jgi:polyhydroxyalkanoate synthesis regulator phasin
MKVWVTKYAMSGIGVIPCEEARYSKVETTVAVGSAFFLHGDDWHTTPEAAIARAEEMRTRKLASLKKQIAKLEAMTFSAEE